jgi:hypothetical protein
MVISEKIRQDVQKLPSSLQVEVLNFVEYLLNKTEQENIRLEAKEWSNLSLTYAIHDMDDEDTSLYSVSDLKEMFS